MLPSIEAKKTLANKKPTYKQKSTAICNVFFLVILRRLKYIFFYF